MIKKSNWQCARAQGIPTERKKHIKKKEMINRRIRWEAHKRKKKSMHSLRLFYHFWSSLNLVFCFKLLLKRSDGFLTPNRHIFFFFYDTWFFTHILKCNKSTKKNIYLQSYEFMVWVYNINKYIDLFTIVKHNVYYF